MATWDRSTPWRQGHILKPETIALLGEPEPEEQRIAAVVASHDCDLSQPAESEPLVEIILGRYIDAPDGNYTNSKNLRLLHIECSTHTGTTWIELDTRRRVSVPKELLSGVAGAPFEHEPSHLQQLSNRERNTLQLWLAARYRRAAFPDEFDRRLKDEVRLLEPLSKALRETGQFIPAIFFDLDEGMELQREGANNLYELAIILLYATDRDPQAAEAAALAAKNLIETAFKKRCQPKDAHGAEAWQWIELVDVIVMSDTALTYAQSTQLKKWQIDHISLRADPAQPVLGN